MAILNYTTAVDEGKTVLEIQALLIRAGAQSMQTDFGPDAKIAAVSFDVQTSYGLQRYRLPANVDGVFEVMTRQKKAGDWKGKVALNRDQARRAAWRITKDWLEAQLALVESNQVSVDQIMMPYMQVSPGVSLYELMLQNRLELPEGPK